jgi:uroporphyrinogen-III decarboxylase
MSNGVPDRVPIIPQICVPHAIRALGMDYESTLLQVVRNPALMNKINFQCVKEYGVDGLRVWMPPDPLDVAKVDGIWYGFDPQTGRRLGRVDFAGGGAVLPLEEPTLVTEEDIERIPVVSADDVIRSGKLNAVKPIIDEAGEDYFVISYAGHFTVEYLTVARGKMQAMIDLVERPEFCHKAQEKALQAAIQNGLALARIGIHGLMIADVYGGVISPAHFKEFCLPYFRRFVEAMRPTGTLIYLHVCGNSRGILEMMADTGVNCIEPLDPLGGVEVKDARRRVGHRVALMGGVNTVKLAHGSLSEVIDDCRRCLQEGAVNGGYILAAGDMLPTETSKEKVQAMVEAARTYTYP